MADKKSDHNYFFFEKMEKRKMLRIFWFGEKIGQKNILKIWSEFLLCRYVRRKISADVDGGLSRVSRCADTGARTPIGVSGNFHCLLQVEDPNDGTIKSVLVFWRLLNIQLKTSTETEVNEVMEEEVVGKMLKVDYNTQNEEDDVAVKVTVLK